MNNEFKLHSSKNGYYIWVAKMKVISRVFGSQFRQNCCKV